jgi:serine/threonine protein kinase
VLATAADIAQAMLHLHHEAILHSDLKARNVLLKSGSGGGKGYIAKVADFGLSIKLDTHETHVSNLYQVRAPLCCV